MRRIDGAWSCQIAQVMVEVRFARVRQPGPQVVDSMTKGNTPLRRNGGSEGSYNEEHTYDQKACQGLYEAEQGENGNEGVESCAVASSGSAKATCSSRDLTQASADAIPY
ncbi:hypothetical protein N7517_011005 [Penicillium concentricum]|uniref:Uncharacterized protein n=1 Tax=Penicillium concentricum TaxID=293559 RepID=A0A9W9UVL2_9EURO|nr:uncharacterized protein N7517_011005 [Penicillium concentricum]KAJ5356396.1 hypothetical protein N7517_011005 [Penicillium concentricum]